ncbi:MAG: polyprenyl synthetase family protein [Actinomycetota bacterium]
MNLESKNLRDSIDRELRNFLGRVGGEFTHLSAGWIVDQLAEVALNGGKRMRPLLCCWGYAAGGGIAEGASDSSRVVKAAASLELLHTFAIVHDDIMDAALSRRSRPPVHKRIAELDEVKQGKLEPGHYGVSAAILIGDIALALSDRLFMESGFEAGRLAEAWQPLIKMRQDAAAGQYLDISHSGPFKGDPAPNQELNPQIASNIARLKTAGYSIRGPLLVGATLAGASGKAKKALEAYGEAVGEAFQLADDLMGMFGDPEQTGKDRETDLRNGKPTLLIANALAQASEDEKKIIKKAWGNPAATERDIHEARAAIVSSGAVKAVKQRIHDLIAKSKKATENPTANNLNPEPCNYLTSLAEKISTQADSYT